MADWCSHCHFEWKGRLWSQKWGDKNPCEELALRHYDSWQGMQWHLTMQWHLCWHRQPTVSLELKGLQWKKKKKSTINNSPDLKSFSCLYPASQASAPNEPVSSFGQGWISSFWVQLWDFLCGHGENWRDISWFVIFSTTFVVVGKSFQSCLSSLSSYKGNEREQTGPCLSAILLTYSCFPALI